MWFSEEGGIRINNYILTFTLIISTFIIIIKHYDTFYHTDSNYFYFDYNCKILYRYPI